MNRDNGSPARQVALRPGGRFVRFSTSSDRRYSIHHQEVRRHEGRDIMARLWQMSAVLALVGAGFLQATTASADDKIDVSGVWDFEVEIAGTQGMPNFTFKQDGEKLTGKYKGQFGSADVTGKVKGKDIEFAFEIQGGAGKVVYKGTIDKDTMKGEVNYADQANGTWTAKKSTKKES
jgi:hypothetical protein